MTRTLEGLSDLNVGNLSDINKETLPDHSCTYGMVAIFKSVDINVLFNNLTMLSNDSLQTFNHFIRVRNMDGCSEFKKEDIGSLKLLKEKIDAILPTQMFVRKEAFYRISNSLNESINRYTRD